MADSTGILKARAKALAAPLVEEDPHLASLEVLEFILGGEHYAIETSFIRDVQPLTGLTQLPGTPAFLLGIVYLRGQILGVVDLRRFFDLTTQALSNLNRVIVIEEDGFRVGLLADDIVGVRQVAEEGLTPNLPTLPAIGQDYLKGVAADHLIVLNMAKLVADPRLLIDQSE